MEKSHVSIEQHLCIVTGKKFDSGGLLLDKRLKPTLERTTLTRYGISPEVQEKIDEGYIAVVAIDSNKSEFLPDGNIKPSGAYRTGVIAYMKKEFLEQHVNFPLKDFPFMFADSKVVDMLNEIYEIAINEQNKEGE